MSGLATAHLACAKKEFTSICDAIAHVHLYILCSSLRLLLDDSLVRAILCGGHGSHHQDWPRGGAILCRNHLA